MNPLPAMSSSLSRSFTTATMISSGTYSQGDDRAMRVDADVLQAMAHTRRPLSMNSLSSGMFFLRARSRSPCHH